VRAEEHTVAFRQSHRQPPILARTTGPLRKPCGPGYGGDQSTCKQTHVPGQNTASACACTCMSRSEPCHSAYCSIVQIHRQTDHSEQFTVAETKVLHTANRKRGHVELTVEATVAQCAVVIHVCRQLCHSVSNECCMHDATEAPKASCLHQN
jgi:hypothetical protein